MTMRACLCGFSCVRLFVTSWTVAHQVPLSVDFPGKNTEVSCCFLLQGIFPTQGLNHISWISRQILYHSDNWEDPQNDYK